MKMTFRMNELMVIALPENDESAMDTCCAASCTEQTNTCPLRTVVIDSDDGIRLARADEQFLEALRAQLATQGI
jgi:hypothetical protein